MLASANVNMPSWKLVIPLIASLIDNPLRPFVFTLSEPANKFFAIISLLTPLWPPLFTSSFDIPCSIVRYSDALCACWRPCQLEN
jgi:hypothetical protein